MLAQSGLQAARRFAPWEGPYRRRLSAAKLPWDGQAQHGPLPLRPIRPPQPGKPTTWTRGRKALDDSRARGSGLARTPKL